MSRQRPIRKQEAYCRSITKVARKVSLPEGFWWLFSCTWLVLVLCLCLCLCLCWLMRRWCTVWQWWAGGSMTPHEGGWVVGWPEMHNHPLPQWCLKRLTNQPSLVFFSLHCYVLLQLQARHQDCWWGQEFMNLGSRGYGASIRFLITLVWFSFKRSYVVLT